MSRIKIPFRQAEGWNQNRQVMACDDPEAEELEQELQRKHLGIFGHQRSCGIRMQHLDTSRIFQVWHFKYPYWMATPRSFTVLIFQHLGWVSSLRKAYFWRDQQSCARALEGGERGGSAACSWTSRQRTVQKFSPINSRQMLAANFQ